MYTNIYAQVRPDIFYASTEMANKQPMRERGDEERKKSLCVQHQFFIANPIFHRFCCKIKANSKAAILSCTLLYNFFTNHPSPFPFPPFILLKGIYNLFIVFSQLLSPLDSMTSSLSCIYTINFSLTSIFD